MLFISENNQFIPKNGKTSFRNANIINFIMSDG